MEEFGKYGSASGQRQPQRRKCFDTLVVGIKQGQDRSRVDQTLSPPSRRCCNRARTRCLTCCERRGSPPRMVPKSAWRLCEAGLVFRRSQPLPGLPLGHDLVEKLGYARFMDSGRGFKPVFHFGRDAPAIYFAFVHVVQCRAYMMPSQIGMGKPPPKRSADYMPVPHEAINATA